MIGRLKFAGEEIRPAPRLETRYEIDVAHLPRASLILAEKWLKKKKTELWREPERSEEGRHGTGRSGGKENYCLDLLYGRDEGEPRTQSVQWNTQKRVLKNHMCFFIVFGLDSRCDRNTSLFSMTLSIVHCGQETLMIYLSLNDSMFCNMFGEKPISSVWLWI